MKRITFLTFFVLISIAGFGQWQSNFGIGTNNPTVKLDISDSTDTDRTFLKLDNKSISTNSSVNLRLIAGQNGSFTSLSHLSETYTGVANQADFGQLWTSGAGLMLRASGGILRFETSEEGATYERMRINTEGNVGIGVEMPRYKFDVDGDINISSGHNFLIDGSPIVADVSLWQTDENNIFFNSGNVGIGTNNPLVKFDIADSTNTDRTFIKLENKSLNNASSVNIRLLAGQNGSFTSLSHLSETYTGVANQADFGQLWTSGAGLMLRASGGIIKLETSEEGATYERMRINTQGNVGINTTEPSEKLEVNGNILIKNNNALILTSPNGTEYKITVDDSGNLTTSEVTSTKTISVEMNIDIYPNPTNNQLTVHINEQYIQEIDAEIYDMSGKIIFMKNYDSNSFQINTADLTKGTYLLKLKGNNGNLIKTEKFIKQ